MGKIFAELPGKNICSDTITTVTYTQYTYVMYIITNLLNVKYEYIHCNNEMTCYWETKGAAKKFFYSGQST